VYLLTYLQDGQSCVTGTINIAKFHSPSTFNIALTDSDLVGISEIGLVSKQLQNSVTPS